MELTQQKNWKHPKQKYRRRGRMVKCVETGKTFPSCILAANAYHATNSSSLLQAIDEPNRTAYGVHWVSVE